MIKSNYIFTLNILIVTIIAYCFSKYLFVNNLLGSDYGYYLPILSSNKAWFFSKGLVPPLFTPNFCAGFVSFANPQDFFYSFKQLFFNVFSINNFLIIILIFYSIIGFLGTFLLLNQSFQIKKNLAYLGSYFFTFNGFFLVRYLVGHLGFLDFALLPLFMYLVIKSTQLVEVKFKFSLVIICGLIFASLIYAGSIAIIINFFCSALAILIIYYDKYKFFYKNFINMILSTVLGILISSLKISLFLEVLNNIPRDLSSIFFIDYISYIKFILNALFGFSSIYENNFFQESYLAEFHELNYNIGFLGILFVFSLFNKFLLRKYILTYSGILFTCLIIGFISTSENINNFLGLNQITIIPWRFLSILIIPIILISLININNIFEKKNILTLKINFILCLIIALFLSLQFFTIKNQFSGNYKINPTMQNYELGQIKYVSAFLDKNKNNFIYPILRNDLIFNNSSTLNCYEPIHGYQNEKMVTKDFKFTEIKNYPELRIALLNPLLINNGRFGFYNPACFLYPEVNNCNPYDTFKENEFEKLKNFLSFNKFEYKKDKSFIVFLVISISIFFLCLSFLIFILAIIIKRQFRPIN